jgi:hypothetical protein
MMGGGNADCGKWSWLMLLIPLVLMPALLAFGLASYPKESFVCEDRIITQGSCSDYPGSRGSELVVNFGVATCRCKK